MRKKILLSCIMVVTVIFTIPVNPIAGISIENSIDNKHSPETLDVINNGRALIFGRVKNVYFEAQMVGFFLEGYLSFTVVKLILIGGKDVFPARLLNKPYEYTGGWIRCPAVNYIGLNMRYIYDICTIRSKEVNFLCGILLGGEFRG